MKTKIYYLIIFLLTCFVSCDDDLTENLELNEEVATAAIPTIELDEGALSFGSKESLADFLQNKSENLIENTLDDLKSRGFASLNPTFEDLEGPEVESFLADKAARIASKGKLYSTKGNNEDISLEDELISDSKFAKLLNVNRGIIVGKKYYVYTTDGLYFCQKKNRKLLNKYIKKLSSSKSFVPSASKASDCNAQKNTSKNEAVNLSLVSGKVTSVTNEISRYVVDCGGGGGSGGGSGGTTNSSSDAAAIPLIKPMSFGSCSYSQNSVWQQVFGRRIKCFDYHDSTHRVKTQFWNENYLIYASIGSKVIYQKKRWLGWSKSGTSDFVELGLNSVKYTWNHPKQYNPFSDVHIKYKYKGVTYRSDGTQTYDGPVNPKAWPYENKDEVLIPIYIQIDDILGKEKWDISYRGLKGKDINRAIKDLLKSASKLIPTNTGFQEEMRKNNIDVKIMRYAPTETNVIVSNRIKRQTDGDAYFRFDFNFLLSYDSGAKKILKILAGQLNAKKYTNVEVDLYGAAYRNGVIKGKRITGSD